MEEPPPASAAPAPSADAGAPTPPAPALVPLPPPPPPVPAPAPAPALAPAPVPAASSPTSPPTLTPTLPLPLPSPTSFLLPASSSLGLLQQALVAQHVQRMTMASNSNGGGAGGSGGVGGAHGLPPLPPLPSGSAMSIGTPPGTPSMIGRPSGGSASSNLSLNLADREGSHSMKSGAAGHSGVGAVSGASSGGGISSRNESGALMVAFRSATERPGVRNSPLLPPLSLNGPVPHRVDTDEDLMQKKILWEIDRSEIDLTQSVKLGAGAFGEVVRAKWRGTPVAVKKVNFGAGGAGAISELRHEIAVMSHMHHPRVVQFLGACTRGQPWLLLSEFLKGGNVATVLQSRASLPLPPAMAGRWALDMAQALRYLHEHKPKGVVHRDLKPQNLLLDGSWHVKISDFGLAKVVDQIKALDETYKLTGETGSYRYMAPEVFRHEPYNAKVDIYAFAMICYYFTHGIPPFEGQPPVEAARAAAVDHARPNIRPGVEREFAHLIRMCWDRDAAVRPTAREICSILERLFPEEDDHPAYAASGAVAGVGGVDGVPLGAASCGPCSVS